MDNLSKLMHDTMSPVNTIKGAVHLLKSGTLSKDETIKMLEAIENRADKLNEILDWWFTLIRKKRITI